MKLVDYENFGDNETATYNFSYSLAVNHGSPSGAYTYDNCVGDEVRGVFVLQVYLRASDALGLRPILFLYEEDRCVNNDQDGHIEGPWQRDLKPNYKRNNQWIQTSNTAEDAADSVHVTYTVHHVTG